MIALKWENEPKGLCVVCDKPISERGFYRCIKCRNLCDISRALVPPKVSRYEMYNITSKCCNADVEILKKTTCSPFCHNALIAVMESDFGKYKKVINHEGKAFKVPVRYIIEHGVQESELPKFPRWEADESNN